MHVRAMRRFCLSALTPEGNSPDYATVFDEIEADRRIGQRGECQIMLDVRGFGFLRCAKIFYAPAD